MCRICSERKSAIRRFVRSLGWTISLILVAVVSAFPQQLEPLRVGKSAGAGPATVKLPAQSHTLAASLLQVERRPAITFVPFEMLDPHTRQPIAPTATITLPNGKRVQAKEYYDQLNSFEKWLNEQGYSLRLPGTKTVIEKLAVNESLLSRQIASAPRPTQLPHRLNFMESNSFRMLSAPQSLRLNPTHPLALKTPAMMETAKLNTVVTKVNTANLTSHMRDELVIDSASIINICKIIVCGNLPPATQCTPVQKSQSWNWNTGDPSTFNAYLNGTLSLSGEACKPANMQNFSQNNSQFTLSAEGKAGGYVFNVGGDLLRLTGSFKGNQTNNTIAANLGVFVLGQDVYSLNKSATAQWGIDDSVSKGVDFSTSIPIPVGPFDINVTIGAQGNVGVGYSLNLYPTNVSASANPFVNSSVYAQAGLNIVVAEAGVGVSMTLLDADLQLGVNAGIGWLFGFYLSSEVYADVSLDMLNGNVYVYAKVYYPCFDPWPDICNHQWNADLWSWSGLQYNSVLFDDKTITPLNW
jgi:hypothetical protein